MLCDPIRIGRRTKETRAAFCGPRGGQWRPLAGRWLGRKVTLRPRCFAVRRVCCTRVRGATSKGEFCEPSLSRVGDGDSTSASQTCGSALLSFAVWMRVYMRAAGSAPRSDAANSAMIFFRVQGRAGGALQSCLEADPPIVKAASEDRPARQQPLQRPGAFFTDESF